MPTFIKTGFWEESIKGYKGWLNLEELIINTVPPQATIYTSNGTLTGNRIMNSGGFTLTLNPATTFGSTVGVNGALRVGSIGGISQINGGSTVASTYLSSNFYVAIGSQNNLLYGERDVAIGLRNSITGRRWNYIYGNDNVIRGLTGGSGNAYNFIFGNNSTIGDSNLPAVFRAEYSYLIGFSNSVVTTTSNASNNVIIGRASSVQNVSFNVLIGNVVSSAFNYVTILTSGPGDVVGQYRTATEDNELSLSAGGKLKFHAAAVQNAATIFTTGNFAINSTSDAGFKLDVNGTARVQGSLIATGTSYISPISTIGTYNAFSTFNVVNDGPASIAVDRFSNNGTSPHFNLRKSRGTSTTPAIVQTNDELGYVGFWGHDGTSFQRNGIILVQAENVTGTTITPLMRFGVGTNASSNQYGITLTSSFNTVLGNYTTDAGQKLQVYGDTLLKGSGATSATSALVLQNSTGVVTFSVNNAGSAYLLDIFEPGRVRTNLIEAKINQSITIQAPWASNNTIFLQTWFGSDNGVSIGLTGNNGRTGGSHTLLLIGETFNPTSGNASFQNILINPTINQTGGANGVTRGIYIAPTLTAAADFRAIETTTGKVIFGNLPTSSAGLPSGAIWNNAGVVNIVP
jgi:hypothetical protein